eukprot:1825471-Pyramimonas_sp.AAC.1
MHPPEDGMSEIPDWFQSNFCPSSSFCLTTSPSPSPSCLLSDRRRSGGSGPPRARRSLSQSALPVR